SHCNNVGSIHRASMYPTLKRWLNVEFSEKESTQRRTPEELACLTPEVVEKVKPRPLHEIAAELGAAPAEGARKRLAEMKPADRRQKLREDWTQLLGDVESRQEPKVKTSNKERSGSLTVELLALEVEPGIMLPVLVLSPEAKEGRRPVIVGFAQE